MALTLNAHSARVRPFTSLRAQCCSAPRRLTSVVCYATQSKVQQGLQIGAATLSAMVVLASASPAAQALDTIVGPARTVDGDTLVVQGQRVRLYGIDAPESSQSCRDAQGKEYPCGQVSKEALAKLIGTSPVQCAVKNTDQYGRNVSVCSVGNLEVNRWLVDNGQAVAYRQYGKEYIAAEDAAHAARKGVWQGDFQTPSEWRKENKRSGSGASPPSAMVAALSTPACANPIKGNINGSGEKIYHKFSGKYYDRVTIEVEDGERYFCSEAEAEAAGWRASKQ